MFRMNIQIPQSLKFKLDTERKCGTSAAGLIRHLLIQYFKGKKAAWVHTQEIPFAPFAVDM